MSMLVAAIIFVLLLAIAIAHFMWSMGASWPIRDKALLAQTVIGRPGVTRVPRLMSLVIAILVLAAGTIGLAIADKTSGGIWLTLAGEPFATLDRRNYSPLSLLIGAGFLLLVAMRLL